jgi:hypothetical protein
MLQKWDVVVIGGGHSGLSAAYHLTISSPLLSYVVFDDHEAAGAFWRSHWDSLVLFSPCPFSSLPGYEIGEEMATLKGGISSDYDEYFPTRLDVVCFFLKLTSPLSLIPITISSFASPHSPRNRPITFNHMNRNLILILKDHIV